MYEKNLVTFLFCFITALVCLGQNHSDSRNKEKLYYDDWPVTVESNANRKLISKDLNVDWVPIGTTWDHRIITYFFQNGTNDIDGNNERQAIKDAFALWSAQTDLFFLQVCSEDDADIAFLWGTFNHGDARPFDGEGNVLAHTLGGPPPNNFGDQAGDMHFDDSETWTLNTRDDGTQPIDLVTVAAHEIGHALGLDHTTVAGSLMLDIYTGSHRYLGSDDIAGIRYLYGLPGANLPISGSYVVCSAGSAFTANGLPDAVESIVWDSGPNLQRVSSQGSNPCTFSSTGNGSSWVRATLYSDCDNITLRQKDIWSGTFESTVVTGTAAVCPNSLYVYTAQVPGGHSPSYSYSWTYPGNWYYYSQWDNYIHLQTPSSPGYGTVRVAITNSCGTSGYSGITVYPRYGCGKFFTLYPNPASDELTITIDSDLTDQSSRIPQNNDTKYNVRIYNNNGILVSNTIRSGISFSISLWNLRDGTYILELSDGKNSYREQFIIKH